MLSRHFVSVSINFYWYKIYPQHTWRFYNKSFKRHLFEPLLQRWRPSLILIRHMWQMYTSTQNQQKILKDNQLTFEFTQWDLPTKHIWFALYNTSTGGYQIHTHFTGPELPLNSVELHVRPNFVTLSSSKEVRTLCTTLCISRGGGAFLVCRLRS